MRRAWTVAWLALALVSGVRAEPGWRDLSLDGARLQRLAHEVHRAIQARWRKRLKDFDVHYTGPRLRTDGEQVRLAVRSFSVLARRWYLGDLPVQGRIDFGQADLDYARLGVGELGIVGETRGRVHVRIDHAGLSELLAEGGFEDVGYEWVPETQEFVLWGYRPIKLLFFRLRPRIKVRLQVFLEGTEIGFRGIQIFVSSIPRFIEKIAERRIMKRLGERIRLQKDFRKLARHGIRVEGGVVEIMGMDGAELLRVEVPGDPTLPPAEPPVTPPVRAGPLSLEP